MPERLQKSGRFFHGCRAGRTRIAHTRSNLSAAAQKRIMPQEPDAQTTGVHADFFLKTSLRRRRSKAVTCERATNGIQDCSAIAHRSRDHVLGNISERRGIVVRFERHSSARWLETDQSTTGSRDADRASAIVCVCNRHHAAGDGRGGAATRAARRTLGIPWVTRCSERRRLGSRRVGKLRKISFTYDDESRLAETPGELRIGRRAPSKIAQET